MRLHYYVCVLALHYFNDNMYQNNQRFTINAESQRVQNMHVACQSTFWTRSVRTLLYTHFIWVFYGRYQIP